MRECLSRLCQDALEASKGEEENDEESDDDDIDYFADVPDQVLMLENFI